MQTIWLLWAFLIICIILSAVFSSSETALSTVNRIRLKSDAQQGNKKAGRVLRLYQNYNRSLTGILIGNNLVNIMASTVGTVIFTSYFGSAGPGVATVFLTLVLLIFGEVMPKSYAKDHADKLTRQFSGFLHGVIFIFTPFIFFFDGLKKLMEKFSKKDSAPSVTEQELKVMIHEIEDEGVLEDREGELVRSALDFDETTVDEAMTPRVDIVSIEKNADVEEIKNVFFEYHYSRLPVYEKDVDNIVGILYEKDFFKAYLQETPFSVESLMQTAMFVPPQMKISELLKKIQAANVHMAIVVDSYGGVEGMITLEDIVEELVGEIYDEYDVVSPEVQKISPDTYRVRADMGVDDMMEKIGYAPKNLESESNTVGGWLLENFGKVPKVGNSFEFENLVIKVTQMKGKRICWLTVRIRN